MPCSWIGPPHCANTARVRYRSRSLLAGALLCAGLLGALRAQRIAYIAAQARADSLPPD